MNFIYFILIGLVIFLSVLLGGKKYRSTALYALAIGGIVNANFFHAGNFPISCFGLDFGIDSILYTLFIFCAIVMLIKEDKKSAYLLAISGIVAIIFSAAMQLTADILSNGSSLIAWKTFLGFIISAFASIIAVIAMLEILGKLKPKLNPYILMIIGIVIATIVNSGIYYPLTTLLNGAPSNISSLLLTSILGKLIALLFSVLTLFIVNKSDKIYK